MAGAIATATLLPLAVAGGGATAGAASSDINPNGVLKYGYDLNNEFANDFDPGTEQNDCSYTVYQNIFESVTAPDTNTSIAPGVAQSWTIDNPSMVTLHIRPNMVFSNGDPVTATDVELSLEHTKTSPLRTSLSAIQTMTVVNPTTLVVNLNRPTAGDFMWAMTYIDGSVMDPSSIGSTLHPIGAGPFMLKSYSQGSSLDLVKNPKFFDSTAYPLGGVDFIEVQSGPPVGQRSHLGRGGLHPARARGLPRGQERPQHRHRHDAVLGLHGAAAAGEHGPVRQPEGPRRRSSTP